MDDVARGHLLAMARGKPAETYLLAGEAAGLADGLRLAVELADTPRPVVLPSAAIRLSARLMAPAGRLVRLPDTYTVEAMQASLATYVGSPREAQRELGWTCRPLRKGLADLRLSTRDRRSENSP